MTSKAPEGNNMDDAPIPVAGDQPTRGPDYERLLSLLEQASAGEWALDKQIALLERERIGDCADDEVPPYTTSLDAALSLVPEGCAFSVGCEIDFTPTARVFGHDIHAEEFAATPALALCIASLKARQP